MDRAPVVVGRAPLALPPGTTIADKYRVDKELGRGGFGIVLRATHLTLDVPVAIKVLTEAPGTPEEWAEDAERFRREAQATAALRGENIVRILDVDALPSGCPYMVMEYLEGETLHTTIHTKGPLPIPDAVDHALQILAALGEAHAAGIVHRDLKPANVLITKGKGNIPVIKVLDFGVSKVGAADATKAITRTGAVIGTVIYMSPEQMVDAKRVDARTDLWSVGVMLYEMLTKHTPFGPPNAPTLVTTTMTQPPTPLGRFRRDIPPELEHAIGRALEKRPERRFQTAGELAEALAFFGSPRSAEAVEALRHTPPPRGHAAPPGSPEAGDRRSSRAPGATAKKSKRPPGAPRRKKAESSVLSIVLLGLGFVVALLLAYSIVVAVQRRQARTPNPAPQGTNAK